MFNEKVYYPDGFLKFKLILTSYKKHPFWKKRLPVRLTLIAIGVLFALYLGFDFYRYDGSLYSLSLGIITGSLFGFLPYLVYWAYIRETCSEGIRSKTNEVITLGPDALVNLYLPARASRVWNYQENVFKYTKIQKIEYFPSSRKVYLYGTYLERYYKDYFEKKVGQERGIHGERVTLFLYYEDSDDFLKTLASRCNKEIIIME